MKLALLSPLFGGCLVVPFVDSSGRVTGCCEAFYKPNRSTLIGISVERVDNSYTYSAHAKWAFQ